MNEQQQINLDKLEEKKIAFERSKMRSEKLKVNKVVPKQGPVKDATEAIVTKDAALFKLAEVAKECSLKQINQAIAMLSKRSTGRMVTKAQLQEYKYISVVNGLLHLHKTWGQCERTVKKVKNADFMKTSNPRIEVFLNRNNIKLL